MPRKKILALVFLALACFGSCNKNNGVVSKPVDVYVAGSTRPSGAFSIASYWKNGSLVTFSDGVRSTWAYGIALSGNDVYVVGQMTTTTGNNVGVYWKNGVLNLLTDSTETSLATAITISGNDVYIAGFGPNGPAYWKNGSIFYLPTPSRGLGQINGITVSGNDVYVAGSSYNSNGMVATYWKNGIRDTLTTGTTLSSAYAIAVNGNDVYVSGTVSGFLLSTAVYWKNGVQVSLTNDVTTGSAGGIAFSGNDLYVAGTAELFINTPSLPNTTSMLYWKNGILVDQGGMSSASSNMVVGGIAVSGADVYVAGSFGNLPGYWKNGSLVQFDANAGAAYGIALATRF